MLVLLSNGTEAKLEGLDAKDPLSAFKLNGFSVVGLIKVTSSFLVSKQMMEAFPALEQAIFDVF